jgi:hypothetical protein
MKKVVTLAVVTAISLAGLLGNAWAGGQIKKDFDLPATLTVTLAATACSAAPGPQVTLQGDLVLAGLNTEVLFRDPGPQISNQPFVVEQAVIPGGQHTNTPTQNIVGGVANNPYMWLQILDAKGRTLTSEMFLGRCDQGNFTATAQIQAPAEATADVVASSCSAAPGPSVVLDGATAIGPLTGRVIFRSNVPENAPAGKINQTVSEIAIQPAALSYPFSAQPAATDTADNPLVSVRFRMEDGTLIGTEERLGRCSSIVAP